MGAFSVWHWIIVLVIVGGVAYAIWSSRSNRRSALAATSGGPTVTTGPKGLGGWLILIVLGQVGGIVKVLQACVEDIELYKTIDVQHRVAVHAELALNLSYLALVVWTTVAMFRTKRTFPSLWKVQAVATVAVPVIDAVMIAALLNVPVGSVFGEKEMGQLIAPAIAIMIWWWYMAVSVRVRNTFVN